ncbi:unnamed protein product [Orchesella dallaii]|uniref:Carrier domain-containing protein n=1 Tax=Orchesella dallaii TaxID=48710 RepID=A0ABP1S8X8_9HEXA
MSKLNIWNEEQVKQLRPDVQYTIVDVTKNSREQWIRIFKSLAELQRKNLVKPIPYVRFDTLNVGDALEFMQQAKHIGKIVCRMPEMRNEGAEIKVFTPLFNETSTYLITGGLGGIGFVVCQWMVSNGAKHVLLAGRSPPAVAIQQRINKMNSQSANVIAVQLDVGNFEQCKHLIQIQIREMNLPPLKGVMHCAAVLADGLVINQHWEIFSSPFTAKVNGTLNLHELTKSLNLEHFVLFSSITSLFGYIGQSNYSAGNGFQDAFAHYRNSIGLPSTSINWGPWSEVGIATDAEFPGFKGLSTLHGISGFEYVLRRGQRTQTAIFNVTSFKTVSNFISNLVTYFDERVWNGNVSTTEKSIGVIESSTFWDQYSAALELADKINVLNTHIKRSLKNMLKLDESDDIGDDLDMQELGVDSLMFVEIKNLLQTLLDKKLTLTPSSIRDCNTVTQISNRIVALIEGTHKIGIKPTRKEVNELIREDCKLAEHIHAKPSQRIGSVTDIKRVLLTGSTGTFGPYVLKLLTNLSQITQVVCLMRKVKHGTLEERLERILSNLDLVAEVDMRKVKCVTGNMAEPHLGLEPNVWEELSGSMDAIFNCAASVQHVGYYRKREGNQNHMRAVNIGGVGNVLEFACENKLKHVYHASTIFAVASLDDETGHVSENWPNVGDFDDNTTLGYPNTKFVGDVLMKQAVERGIPCKVFRFPLMSGESKTGRCVVDYNHALLRHLFIMKSGAISSEPFVLPMLPVDLCADVGVQLFFDEKAQSDIYNVIHTKPDLDQEFVNVAKEFGYAVNFVEFSEFSKLILESCGGEKGRSPLELFKELYQDEDAFTSFTSKSPVIGVEAGGDTRRKWWSAKLAKFAQDFLENQKGTMDYVRQDLMFCRSQGWFDKFGF